MIEQHIPHAVSRALERYGLKITHDDLIDLALECQKGYGRLTYMSDGKERHILMCHGKAVVVVYAPFTGDPDSRVKQRHGKIITVLPSDAANAGNRGSVATRQNTQRLRPPRKLPKKNRQKGWKL